MMLGEQIKQAREQKNMSQEELAEQLGVSRQAVSKWENNTSVPQGINREVLSKVLELEFFKTEVKLPPNKVLILGGWITAAILLFLLVGVWLYHVMGIKENNADNSGYGVEANQSRAEEKTSLKSIRFYDGSQNEVLPEALWYNTAQIESILIQWEGSTPNSIKIFSIPTGTETLEQTELLLTKTVRDGDFVELLSAEVLKNIIQGHVYFELDYGEVSISSSTYSMFYDESVTGE